MFERFSEAARVALFWGRYAASDVGGASIEPEHLLLGLLRTRRGIAASTLEAAGLTYPAVRDQVAWPKEATPSTSVEIPFSASCRRVLMSAKSEDDQMSTVELTTGHLLLGLLREEETQAFQILHAAGLRLNDVRAHVESAAALGPERRDPDSEFLSGPP